MNRLRYSLFVLLVFLLSCKKDTLHWQSVQQLDAHTNSQLNRAIAGPAGKLIVSGGEKFLKCEVLISDNGGSNWAIDSFPEAGKGLYGLAMSPSGNVYMTGFDGKFIYTMDSCKSWQFKQLPTWRYNTCIAFPEDDHGLLVASISIDSGFIAHVNAAGDETAPVQSYPFGINDIYMLNTKTGFMVGYGVVLKTTDGGYNWSYLAPASDNFRALYCLDQDHVYICGNEGSIYKTTDGGATWEHLRNGNDLTKKKYRLQDIWFTDAMHGYAVGEEGVVIYTDDGGYNWAEFDKFTDNALRFIIRAPDGSMLTGGEHGALYRLVKK